MIVENLTKTDVKKIEEEINHRKFDIRPKALEDLKSARAQGDLSENFEYYAAKKFNRENNSRINYLENLLKNANIIDDDDNGGVSINNTVKVSFLQNMEDVNDYDSFKLVTSIRGNSLENKISIESPIGKAIFGKKINDVVEVHMDNNKSYFLKIIDIIKENIGEDNIKQY